MSHSIPIVIGDSRELGFLMKDPDGAIMDITGINIEAVFRDYDGNVLLTKSAGAGLVVENVLPETASESVEQEPHGTIFMSEAETSLLSVGAVQELVFRLEYAGDTDSSIPVALEGLR